VKAGVMHMAEQVFQGKIALVTGAAEGIGFATAKAFAESGAAVALLDLNESKVSKAGQALAAAGHRTLAFACDVADEQQVKDSIEHTISTLGGLDLACNNAGIQVPAVDTVEALGVDFDRALAVNLRGVWNCMKYELAHMRKLGAGSIVNVSSTSGLAGLPGLGAYTASKHGVIGLTKSAALENASKGIRINLVCPGAIRTPMVERAIEEYPEKMRSVIEGIPLGRLGRPEEIASAILWLSSPGAGFAVGSTLLVDGGYLV
jgi:NAD(P)-dependent dehydrogenase (short-subunit alcohol dehydrogenase family)